MCVCLLVMKEKKTQQQKPHKTLATAAAAAAAVTSKNGVFLSIRTHTYALLYRERELKCAEAVARNRQIRQYNVAAATYCPIGIGV